MTKLSWIILLIVTLVIGFSAEVEAVIFRLNQQGIALQHGQPVRAVIIDQYGTPDERVAYYNPAYEGIDLDLSWAGPNASIYFPDLNQSYLWYNGFWIDKEGYYWSNGHRVFINDPNWQRYWSGYWKKYPHENWHWHDQNHRWENAQRRFEEQRQERQQPRGVNEEAVRPTRETFRQEEFGRERGFDRSQREEMRQNRQQDGRDGRENADRRGGEGR